MKYSGIHIIFIGLVLTLLLTMCKTDDMDKVVFKKATLHTLTDLIDSIRIVRLNPHQCLHQ